MPRPASKRVVVVGAGLTALSAALALEAEGIDVTVLEANDTLGGVVQSAWVNNDTGQSYLVENGPHTFQPSGQALMALCHQLNLDPLASSPLAKDRFVFWNDNLQPVPMSPMAFLQSKLLSPLGKLRLVTEGLRNPTPPHATVAEWVTHRLGKEALTTLVGPFLSGVYAGDPNQLIARYVFRPLVALEEAAGSVTLGGLQKVFRKKKKDSEPPKTTRKKQLYALMNFAEGMATLPKAMANPLSNVRLNMPVHAIEKTGNQWSIICNNGEKLIADGLCITTPTHVTASLLGTMDTALASQLNQVPYAPMVVVHIAFRKSDLPNPLNGFGFLVPRETNIRMLGSIWVSSLYDNRCPDDEVLLTVFIGGATDPTAIELGDDALQTLVVSELAKTIGLRHNATPTLFHVKRWAKAIPQYVAGHGDVLAAIDGWHNRYPMCQLAGNFRTGVAMNDCILQGQQAANTLIQQFQTWESEPPVSQSCETMSV